MHLLKLVLFLLVSLICNIQTTSTMALPAIKLPCVAFDIKTPEPATDFKRENLGKVMSVLGFLKNKELEKVTPPFTGYDEPKPLFENFEGGEWVLVPLKKNGNRLCAGIFASTLFYEDNYCYIITEKIISSEDHSTAFSYIVAPLTNLYLFKKHFTFDKQGDPEYYKSFNPDQVENSEDDSRFNPDQPKDFKEDRIALEKSICDEFAEWLEDTGQEIVIRLPKRNKNHTRASSTRKSPLFTPLLPEISDQL